MMYLQLIHSLERDPKMSPKSNDLGRPSLKALLESSVHPGTTGYRHQESVNGGAPGCATPKVES